MDWVCCKIVSGTLPPQTHISESDGSETQGWLDDFTTFQMSKSSLKALYHSPIYTGLIYSIFLGG